MLQSSLTHQNNLGCTDKYDMILEHLGKSLYKVESCTNTEDEQQQMCFPKRTD